MKTISVVIAAFAAQDWLQDCLRSIFRQQLPAGWKLQVLLGIDGCPTTLHHVREQRYGDRYPNLTVIALPRNRGTYITFNTLMQLATSELVCRFDADDVMLQGFLARQIDALTTTADMTMTWSVYTDTDLVPTSHVIAHDVYHPAGGLNRRGSEGCIVMRRAVWRHLGGFRPWRCGADTDFMKRARHAGFHTHTVEQFLYLRRVHHNSLTAHPETNFHSPLRLKIQALTEQFEHQYASNQLSLSIQPELEADYAFV